MQDFLLEEAILDALVNPAIGIQEDRAILSSILNPTVIPERDISFQLFTKDKSDEAYMMKLGDSKNLIASSFNASRPTKIIIHGWTDSSQTPWVGEMRKIYLITGDYNVICLDWFAGSMKEYLVAVKITYQVSIRSAPFSSERNDFPIR